MAAMSEMSRPEGAGVEGVRRGAGFHLGQNGLLDLQALRAALLDELGVRHGPLHGGGQADGRHDLPPALRGNGVKLLQSIQALVHLGLAPFELLVVDVVQGHGQPAHGELDGPAGADHAAAHAGGALDICNLHNDISPFAGGAGVPAGRCSAPAGIWRAARRCGDKRLAASFWFSIPKGRPVEARRGLAGCAEKPRTGVICGSAGRWRSAPSRPRWRSRCSLSQRRPAAAGRRSGYPPSS